MRVIAGKARRLPLKTPEGLATRPTTDRIKETLFNMLQNDIPDCIFVDLFSGSGGIGIEAISRGARKAYFVEQGADAYRCIQENLRFTRLESQAITLKQDVYAALSQIHESRVDVIFADPPYHEGHEEQLLAGLSRMEYVTPDTLIIVEADLHTEVDFADKYGFEVEKVKQYKTNKHLFFRKK